MDRTPPTANGSKPKGTVSSPVRRIAPEAPTTTSPKFPPIKKFKKTSPKKNARNLNGKGVSLPKVSSVTFSNDIGTQELDSGEELEVLKCILVREGYLQRLGRASTAGHIAGAHLSETVDVLDLLRLATLETVEAIVAWRSSKQKSKAKEKFGLKTSAELEQFKWNGINYLLKMASDLEFLGKHSGLIEWLGFTLQRNPFILPLNLDCRAKLVTDQQPNRLAERIDTADSNRFLQVGGKRVHATEDGNGFGDIDKFNTDAEALAQLLAERKRAKTPYETRVVNDEELVPNTPSKIGSLRPKSRVPARSGKTKYSSVLPSQIGEVDMARLHDAEVVVLHEEAAFGRYTRDIHGRVVPEDEAQRRFSMVELSGNVYKVSSTLESSYTAEDAEGNVLRLGNPTNSDVPGKMYAKKRSGMLGPISKPEWRSFDRPPPPRRRARGAQLEEALAAERKANARLGVLLDSMREETERKAMDVAYFESCVELQVYGDELRAFTTQAQRELDALRREFEEKKYMYQSKIVNIQKKEEMLNTFKAQHKATQDATHAKRVESSREESMKVASLNQEQQRREDQEQAASAAKAAAERHQHDQTTPLVQHFCATQIQKFARGMLAREMYEQMKIEFVVASSFIQAGVRGFLARRRVAKMYWHNAASVHLQRVARGFLARRVAQAKRWRRRRELAAERIQKVVRGRFGRVRMVKIRELMTWRLQLALAAQAINAVALKELATECQEMVALPALMRTEANSTEHQKSLPALVLGLVRLLMIFTSDSDDEWNIPTTRWREAARFLRCGVSITRRMQKIADSAAGAARALMSPSKGFAADGVAASTPYLRESRLGSALLEAYKRDLDFQVSTFERIPRGWQAAVAIFKWTTAFNAITRLQHLLEPSTASNDPFLVIRHTLSKREAQHELTERRDADHNDEEVARRFVPAELVQARGYPLHRPRPLLLVVANDVPRKAKTTILDKLQAALPGLFLTITRPPAVKKRSLGVEDSTQAFDFQAIHSALALGHSVILEGDVGLRDVTQRTFLSCFATIKSGLEPPPMCVLLRGTFTNRSDLFGPKQGADKEEQVYREEMNRRMVDAEMKLALDRTTRLRLELAEDEITREMIEQSSCGFGDLAPAPNSALVVVMEAVIILLTPGKAYEGPSQSDIATSSVSWRLSRRLLAQPAFLRTKLQQVNITTIPPVNLVALERYLRHSLWPNAVVSRSQVDSSRLLHGLALWVESVTRTARMIASDGTGFLAPEITRFKPVPGLFERVVVFDNCPTDHMQEAAGEDVSVMQLMDAVLADVRVYRTAHLLETLSVHSSNQHRKTMDEERCVVSLFHECRRIFVSAYSPRTGQRWLTVISEDDIDSLLIPLAMTLGGEVKADRLPPTSHTEMYTRLARLCLLQKRRLEDVPAFIEAPSPYELVVRPHAVRLYRHVLQLGGYLTTLTIAELARGHVQVDAFVHGSNSQKSLEQAVALTLTVELENVFDRLSAAQARRIFVPSPRISSLLLDRLRLYCVTRSPMITAEFQPKLVSALRLSVRKTANSPGRILLRRAVWVPGNHHDKTSGERWVFTLVGRHENGTFEAAFYAPGSSISHSIPLSRGAAQNLLCLSRHTTSSQLHQVLLRSFCFARDTSGEDESSEADEDAVEEEGDRIRLYRQRRQIIARFPFVLRVLENPHQRVTKNRLVRLYVQVELCDLEPEEEESTTQRIARNNEQALRYRVWLPESCVEQTLTLRETEIEASLSVELSWQHAQPRERRSITRQIVQRYFAWDPNGGGDNGCVVAHLPCGSFWATEVLSVGKVNQKTSPDEDAVLDQREQPNQNGKFDVVVVSCTHLLDDRDTESDDEEDDDANQHAGERSKRKIYSYDTEEVVHRGSYRANGLYVIVRVTMFAQVIRDLKPALVSPTDRVRESDSFTMKFHVYHPASSGIAVIDIRGHRDLREVVGPDKSFLIASTSLDSLMRHIILARLDVQEDHDTDKCLNVAFLRDRLYAKQKATPVTKTFERDASVNAAKLIDESRHRGRAGERGVKVLTTAKVLSGCGRTLLTVFDVAERGRTGQSQESANCSVLLRVDAYVCATSERLSLLLEGSDLVHAVGSDDENLLSSVSDNDSSSEEGLEMEKKRSQQLAMLVLDHIRIEQRSDGRGNRLVLSDYAYNIPDIPKTASKSTRLFKTVRAVGHGQVLLSVFLDSGSVEDANEAKDSLRLDLYDPTSSSRCTLKLSPTTLDLMTGVPGSLELLNSGMGIGDLMMHVLSFVHIDKISDGVHNRPATFAMTLLFDEQQAMECMKQHLGNNTESCINAWIGPATGRDGNYFSLHLQILQAHQNHTQSSEKRLSCSAFSPSEMVIGARTFEWQEIPAELRALLLETAATDFTSFFQTASERLSVKFQQEKEENQQNEARHRRAIALSFT